MVKCRGGYCKVGVHLKKCFFRQNRDANELNEPRQLDTNTNTLRGKIRHDKWVGKMTILYHGMPPVWEKHTIQMVHPKNLKWAIHIVCI